MKKVGRAFQVGSNFFFPSSLALFSTSAEKGIVVTELVVVVLDQLAADMHVWCSF